VSGCGRRKLSVKGQSVSLSEMSFTSLHDHVISQFDFQKAQPGFVLSLILNKIRSFGIADNSVPCVADSRCERFVSG
jgi:hypothetical protein